MSMENRDPEGAGLPFRIVLTLIGACPKGKKVMNRGNHETGHRCWISVEK